MKSRSINTLSLALLISMAPALQANEQENSSWLAPLSSSTIIIPVIGIGVSYLAYKLYTNYNQDSDLAVIAPWHKEERMVENPTTTEPITTKVITSSTQELPVTQMSMANEDELDSETIDSIIQSGLDLFSQAHVPELVMLHDELRNPNLSIEEKEKIVAIIEQLEHEAPALEQTVPPLMVYLSLLSILENELHVQATNSTRSVSPECIENMNKVSTIMAYVTNYLHIYGQDIQAEFINEINQQLERELNECTQANTL